MLNCFDKCCLSVNIREKNGKAFRKKKTSAMAVVSFDNRCQKKTSKNLPGQRWRLKGKDHSRTRKKKCSCVKNIWLLKQPGTCLIRSRNLETERPLSAIFFIKTSRYDYGFVLLAWCTYLIFKWVLWNIVLWTQIKFGNIEKVQC